MEEQRWRERERDSPEMGAPKRRLAGDGGARGGVVVGVYSYKEGG